MPVSSARFERTRCYRRAWAFERAGWVAMAAIVAGAVAGVFGNGMLSGVAASAGGSFVVQYPRYFRAHAPFELSVEWLPRQHEATLWFERSYLDGFEVQEVRPPPAAVTADSRRIYYTFPVREPGERVEVGFALEPDHGGVFRGRVGSDDRLEIEIHQFVFP